LGHFSQLPHFVDRYLWGLIYSASMQENNNHTVLFALLKALRPIARFLMKAGIGYREFAEISKCAFVDVATSDYGLRGRPTNISRVAVMTGLTRKEVKRLRQKIAAGSQIVLDKVIPPAEIIQKWHTDPKFLDDFDRPLTLPFDGASPSFAELVKKFGGDIPPGAMRTELKRVGAVAESEDGHLTVTKRYFRPIGEQAQLQRALGQAMYGIANTINHNLGRPEEKSWIERIAYSQNIREADKNRVKRISTDRASEFVESINDLFSAYETIYADEPIEKQPGVTVVGVGVYYFEVDESEGEFAKPPAA
jgi:Family of unknown function (DUF6502)